ncbi:Polyol phosphate phosphatase PYP1 [Exophiala dermatitidis]
MPFPETLNKKPRVIFFTDFDGTITLQDTNDFITDNYGMGYEERRKLFHAVINHTDTFRNTFQQMLDSWHLPFPRVLEILRDNITLDPYFKEFMVWAREHDVPVIVLSSGMIPVLETLLRHLLGEDLMSDIEIVANEVQLRAPGNSLDVPDGWTIKFHDDSGFGHDKSLTIRPYADAIAKMPPQERPTLLYAGDGVSDLSAARETDLLFARAGQDLVTWCEKEGIPFTTFENWKTILDETKDIYEGKRTVKNLAEEGLKRYRTNSFEENSHLRPTIK